MKKILILLIILLITIIFFVNKKDINLSKKNNNEINKTIEPNAFSGKLIQENLFYKSVKNKKDITIFNKSIFMKLNQNVFKKLEIFISDKKEILDNKKLPITKIDFEYQDKTYYSFSYGKKNKSKKALLIIPGSGSNQSSKIYLNHKDNYHYGLKSKLEKDFDIYVFIKPNEDYLAIHNNLNKINYDYIYNWHINNGGSYSFSYIVQSIAFSKYLKKNYNKVVVAGLSQGAEAAFINSFYSDPDYAIVSSGVSVYHKDLEISSRDQIILPNKFIYNGEVLKRNFGNLKTNFFLSWSKNESSLEYKKETKSKKTCKFYDTLIKVKCHYGGDKHELPIDAIIEYIN